MQYPRSYPFDTQRGTCTGYSVHSATSSSPIESCPVIELAQVWARLASPTSPCVPRCGKFCCLHSTSYLFIFSPRLGCQVAISSRDENVVYTLRVQSLSSISAAGYHQDEMPFLGLRDGLRVMAAADALSTTVPALHLASSLHWINDVCLAQPTFPFPVCFFYFILPAWRKQVSHVDKILTPSRLLPSCPVF